MGILNLLKEFGPATKSVHLSDYRGRTIGIDAMCWLHRSAFTCALELVRSDSPSSSEPHPTRYLIWLRKMLHMFLHFSIQPIFIFDGRSLPAKSYTNLQREGSRREWKQRADHLYEQGHFDEAKDAYGKCIRITSKMVYHFQTLLKHEGICFIQAPYEADAQLGYLYRHEQIEFGMTEDSDLLPYGCRRILIKLERDGSCKEIDLDRFEKEQWSKVQYPTLHRLRRIMTRPPSTNDASMNHNNVAAASSNDAIVAPASSSSSPPSSSSSSNESFIHACVLSGCDYLPSLHGIGLKKAIQWVDDYPRIDTLLYHLKANRKKLEDKWRKEHQAAQTKRRKSNSPADENADGVVDDGDVDDAASSVTNKMSTSEYITHFYKAVLTFQHQLVFDPIKKIFVHLTPLPPYLQTLFDKSIKGDSATKDEPFLIDDDERSNNGDGVSKRTSSSSPSSSSPSPPPSSSPSPPSSSFSSVDMLPSSHPLRDCQDFRFLGPPIPDEARYDFMMGRLNTKTMKRYEEEEALRPIDFTQLGDKTESNGRGGGWKQQGGGGGVSSGKKSSPPPSFFNQPSSTNTTTPATPVSSLSTNRRPFRLDRNDSKPSMVMIGTNASVTRVRQEDASTMEELFACEFDGVGVDDDDDDDDVSYLINEPRNGDDNDESSDANGREETSLIQTQSHDSIPTQATEEVMVEGGEVDIDNNNVNARKEHTLSRSFTPPPPPSPPPTSSMLPSISSNPFAVVNGDVIRSHRTLLNDEVPTFATHQDLVTDPTQQRRAFTNITAAVLGSSMCTSAANSSSMSVVGGVNRVASSSTFLKRIFGVRDAGVGNNGNSDRNGSSILSNSPLTNRSTSNDINAITHARPVATKTIIETSMRKMAQQQQQQQQQPPSHSERSNLQRIEPSLNNVGIVEDAPDGDDTSVCDLTGENDDGVDHHHATVTSIRSVSHPHPTRQSPPSSSLSSSFSSSTPVVSSSITPLKRKLSSNTGSSSNSNSHTKRTKKACDDNKDDAINKKKKTLFNFFGKR